LSLGWVARAYLKTAWAQTRKKEMFLLKSGGFFPCSRLSGTAMDGSGG
jgi:hypothetical protein